MSLMATAMPAGGSSSSSSTSAPTATASTSVSASSSSAAGTSGSSNATPGNSLPFEKDKIWYFTTDQLVNSPSRRCGIKVDDELQYRQMTAYLIQEMGQRLQVSQLCINTAIVYMHRFYAFHSFTHFHRNSMASASLFLAAKVEEQPRKLEHVIRAANKCLPPTTDQNYADLAQELVFNENVLLQTLGFDVAIDHPHTHVVRTCQLVKACKDLAQTSYFLASNSLHLTSMCLQYRPTVVACFCIYLACKWSRWEIPQSTEGKHWFYYVDKSVSLELLKQLTDEFISIYEKSPARLKSKLNSIKAIAQGASNRTSSNSKDNKPKEDWKIGEMIKGYHSNIELANGNDSRGERDRDRDRERDRERDQREQSSLLPPPSMVPQQRRTDGSHQRSSSVGGVPGSGGSSSSSSSSSSSNHKLPNYPGGLPPEAHPDHKSKAGYNNRLPSSHQRSSSGSLGSSTSGGGSGSSSSSQRGSSSSASSSSSSSQQQQQQGRPSMPMDYHKSSRGMPPVGVSGVGIPSHSAHKMPSINKPQSQQQAPSTHPSASNSSSSSSSANISSKEKSQSSKMYPQAPPPPYSSNNSAQNNPLMSRGGYPGGSNGGSQPAPQSAGGYSGGHRSKSGSSVHSMPPFEQQLPYSQSQGYNHLQQQPPQQQQSTQLPLDASSANQSKNSNSLFSPEWNDIKKEFPYSHNGLLPPPALPAPAPPGHDYKLNNHNPRDKESPKKERLTPTKKDKHRPTMPSMGGGTSGGGSGTSSVKPMLPPHKIKPPHGSDMLPNTPLDSTGGNPSLKRANDNQYGLNKLDDIEAMAISREKMRKVDNASGYPGGYDDKHQATPLSMSNGIETTPDLVRSLLKESLCPSNPSLLKPDTLTMPGLKPPAELLEPMPPTTVAIKKEPMTVNPNLSSVSTVPAAPMDIVGLTKLTSSGGVAVGVGDIKEESASKSEKKKKKDKHKHKEKDKSKDKSEKEERKKHKKDKQKDRSSSSSSKDTSLPNDSLKLVIKTNTASTANPNGSMQVQAPPAMAAAPPLKLKISKNKVEPNNYSTAAGLPTSSSSSYADHVRGTSSSSDRGGNHAAIASYLTISGAVSNTNTSSSGTSTSSSSSSKRKHSDRDRDKESKKSKSQDYSKYNGAGGGAGGVYNPLGGAGAAPNAANSSSSATGASSLQMMAPGNMVNPNSSAASGIGMGLAPPTALPVYNKK
ncbi:cyclin-T [Drosophila tropicalis]|uniref:cyclin-T n=1 Tax=Drosophila tropicalis TaxID=46794 RepID=UPI0035ABA7AB